MSLWTLVSGANKFEEPTELTVAIPALSILLLSGVFELLSLAVPPPLAKASPASHFPALVVPVADSLVSDNGVVLPGWDKLTLSWVVLVHVGLQSFDLLTCWTAPADWSSLVL